MMGRLTITCSLWLVAACSPQDSAEQALIGACTETVSAYAVHRDANNSEAYADVFTPQGVFATPGTVHEGRAALIAYIDNQPEQITTLHHITTVDIRPTGPTRATGTVYVIVHFSEASESPARLVRIANAIYEDEYEFASGVCRIASRSLRIVMDQDAA